MYRRTAEQGPMAVGYAMAGTSPISGTLNVYHPVPTDAPVSAMTLASQRLEGLIKELHDRLRLLEARLEPVCVPTAPEKTDGIGNAPTSSQHVTFLASLSMVIRTANDRLEKLLVRLEV